MQFIDLKTQYQQIEDKVNKRIQAVLEHGQYIMGPEVQELEEKLAEYTGSKYCISVSSGTDALLIAMMALGVKAGDEVITTPFTFISTGEVICLLGAKPIFIDIDPETYNLDPKLIEAAITDKTKLILPVSLYGQCADFDEINAIAKKHNLTVIEDGAQSFGATYKGNQSCNLSTIGCTSFFPSKPLGGYGDSGACFTNDEELATLMRQIRVHGQDKRYHHPRIGINGRMDTLQAAILLEKLDIFPGEVRARQEIGARYSSLLSESCPNIITPSVKEYNTSVYAQYTIQVDKREQVIERLKQYSIPTAVHYPVPLHEQIAFYDLKDEACFLDKAEKITKQVLSLPMHPYMTQQQQKHIVNKVCEAIKQYRV